jgi:hypothetical protein
LVCWGRKPGARDQQLIQCGGSYTEVAGQINLRCQRPVSWCEVILKDGHRRIHTSNPGAVEDSREVDLEKLEPSGRGITG